EAGCRRNSTETRLRSLILKSVNTSCVTYQLAPPCPPRTSREGLPYLRPEPSPPGALSRPRPPRIRRAPMRGHPALVRGRARRRAVEVRSRALAYRFNAGAFARLRDLALGVFDRRHVIAPPRLGTS